MASFLQAMTNSGLAHPPAFLPSNLQYEVIMGSRAYSVNSPDSDYDIYGFVIPPKDILFPHLRGVIPGFGNQGEKFEQYEEQGLVHKDEDGKMEVSFNIYNIVKYFQLCMDNNPNMLDSLFVPANCVLYSTQVAQIVRDNRKKFLSKKCWQKFKGYAFSQIHKMENKNPTGKRLDLVRQHGYDTKYAYNLIRLLDECEQILTLGDMDLTRAREQMKSIKRGDWSEEQVRSYFHSKLVGLEQAYSASKLPEIPDENEIKQILLWCLEQHYGNLSNVLTQPDQAVQALRDIEGIINRNRSILS